MGTGFELRMLGTVRLLRQDKLVHGLESRKALALLCYLAVEDAPVGRARLADLFWGNLSEARGRGNLSHVVHNLTRLLPGSLAADRHTVRLLPAALSLVDTSQCEALLADGSPESLSAAVGCYRGEFMNDLYLDDCPEFELWQVRQREVWHERMSDALEKLVDRHGDVGDVALAEACARRLLELEPWREGAHRSLIRLLAESGQRCAALKQYEICRRTLANEFGIEPDSRTNALAQSIRDGRPVSLSVGTSALGRVADHLHTRELQVIAKVFLPSSVLVDVAVRALEETLGALPGQPQYALTLQHVSDSAGLTTRQRTAV